MKYLYVILFYTLIVSTASAADAEKLRTRAIGQDSQAQYQLGQLYQHGGEGIQPDPVQAFYWMEQAATNGNTQAQSEVADAYLNGTGTTPDTEKAIYWLTLLATDGHTDAQIKLGQLFEQQSPQLSAQSSALIWYRIAATKDPKAESLYSQLLEKQFNQRRAKQISEIKLLDKLLVETPAKSEPASALSPPSPSPEKKLSSGKLVSNTLIWGSLLILVFVVIAITRQMISKKQKLFRHSSDLQAKQLAEQQQLIKKQKQQLVTLFQQLKKMQQQTQQNAQSSQMNRPGKPDKLELACAVFGYQSDNLPEMKQIKLRYKQLSKVYHPDLKGSEEEMKRLNQSLKIILAYLKK